MFLIAILVLSSLPPLLFGIAEFLLAATVYEQIVAALALAIWAILFSSAVIAGEVRDLRLWVKKNLSDRQSNIAA